jgi:nicotinamidase-related amidase
MSHMPVLRSSERISATTSLLLVVDLQERLIRKIADHTNVVDGCRRLIRGAAICQVPVSMTEQYPAGLGPTVPEIAELFDRTGSSPVLEGQPVGFAEKLRFSAADATGWPAAGDRDDGRFQVVVTGLETHICVLQTALDLLAGGYRVYVAVDATGSRNTTDRDVAAHRLRDSGAVVTTAESVLFEWCVQAGTDRFRQMRDLFPK